jgi:hypothetical protein
VDGFKWFRERGKAVVGKKFLKRKELLDQISNYRFPKEDPIPCRWLVLNFHYQI